MHELYYLLSEIKVADIMTKTVYSVTNEDTVEKAAVIMTTAKLLSAVEPVIRYQRARFRGGDACAAGTPKFELGLQQKQDAVLRLAEVWAAGEAGASLGFATARLFDSLDPTEKAKEAALAEQGVSGMETILFLAHTEADGSLAKASLEALTAAKELAAGCGATLSVGLFGADVAGAAAAVAGCGATSYYGVSDKAFAVSRYATDAAALEALAKAAGATILVAADTARMSRALPGVAARLGGRIDAHARHHPDHPGRLLPPARSLGHRSVGAAGLGHPEEVACLRVLPSPRTLRRRGDQPRPAQRERIARSPPACRAREFDHDRPPERRFSYRTG